MSRRRLLAGLSAFPAAPAVAVAAPSSDAALIQACQRWLALEASINDPDHPDRDKDCQDLAEWPEFIALDDAICRILLRPYRGHSPPSRDALIRTCSGRLRKAAAESR